MSNFRCLILLALGASLAQAAQFKFLPDTVCAGATTNCTTTTTRVVAVGSQRIQIRPYYLLSPNSTGTQFIYLRKSNHAPDKSVFLYSRVTSTPVKTPKGYKNRLGDNDSLKSDTLGPGDTLTYSRFIFGGCLTCTAGLARSLATPGQLGSGERVGLLYGADSTHLDTLWVMTNATGGTIHRAGPPPQAFPATSRDALGRRWNTGTAATVELTPDGARLY